MRPSKRISTGPRRGPLRYAPPAWLAGGALFAVALTLRVLFLHQMRRIPFYDHLFSDSRIYHDLAAAILRGDPQTTAHFMSPLYPYAVALVTALLGGEYFWVRLLQSIGGALGAVALYRIGRKRYGEGPGFFTGLLFAICPLLVYYDNAILIESSLTLLVILFLWVLLEARERDGRRWWIVVGAAAGSLAVFRSSMMLPAILAVAAGVREAPSRRRMSSVARKGALVATGLILVVAPFTVQNYLREHAFVLITSSGGLNFFAGNNAQSSGGFSLPQEIDLAADPNGRRFAEGGAGRVLSSPEVSGFWFGRSAEWIGANPAAFLSLLGRKFLLFWSPSEADQLGLNIEFVRKEYGTVLGLPLPGFVPIAAFSAVGFFFGFRDRARREATVLLLLFTGGYVVAVTLFFFSGRFRVPLLPALLLPAGFGVAEMIARIRAERWPDVARGTALFLAMLALSLAAAPRVGEDYSEEYNRLGMVAFEKRSYDEAQQLYLRSLEYRDRPRTRLNLANAYAAGGMFREADAQYQRVIEAAPHDALAYFNFGNYALQRNNPKQAYLLWLRAVKEDSTLAPAHRNIGLLLARAGRYGEAVQRLEQYLTWERDPAQAEAIRQDLEKIRAAQKMEGKEAPPGMK